MIRIVLAEDNALLRQGLVGLLADVGDVDVVASCGSLAELQVSVAEQEPDLVVTDIRMPPGQSTEGLDAAKWLADEHFGVGIVVLSQHVTPDYALRLLNEGPPNRAYLLKERVSDIDELVRAIRTVDSGESVIDPLVVDALVAASRKGDSRLADLTDREMEVLAEMASGKSNAAIAEQLVLSERAVEKHGSSIFSKLRLTEEANLNRRVAAVIMYLGDQRSA